MPNWIRNIVDFSCDEKVIAKMREEIRSEDRVIDFNKIAPIQKELVGTKSPISIISQKEYDKQEKRIANGKLTEHEQKWGCIKRNNSRVG